MLGPRMQGLQASTVKLTWRYNVFIEIAERARQINLGFGDLELKL